MVHYQEENGEPYYHDHSSDKDSDDDSDLKPRRSCSFSEAEGMLGGSGYYESFTMESSPAKPSNGLHHRSRNNSHISDSRKLLDIESEEEGTRRHHHLRSKKQHGQYTTKQNIVFRIFVFGVGLYILLVVRTMYWMYQNKDYSLYLASNDSHAILPTFTQSSSWAQEKHQQIVQRGGDVRIGIEKRRQERLTRSRPPLHNQYTLKDETVQHNWYAMARLQQQQIQRSAQASLGRGPVSEDQLCGALAKQAFVESPDSFSANSAVNSKSVVVITGILNPLGFNLALQLKEKCGVQKVVGIDNMYPNTVDNRLQLQERIQILTTTFPKMSKPVILSFIGLDPLYKKGSSNHHTSQDEFNLMDLKPTHIVHLSSFAQDVYSNAQVDPQWKNTQSPYIDEEVKNDSYLYQIRSSMVSMEQILASILSAAGPDRPQLLYASSSSAAATPNNDEDARHATTKLIDEILADTYYAMSNFPSIGVRFPNALYGPWGHPGSLVHDHIEWAVRNWNATDDTTIQFNNETASVNNEKHSLGMLYIDDAVEAVLAAMQYDAPKPISIDAVSGVTTSVGSIQKALSSFLPRASAGGDFTLDSAALEREDGFLGWKPQTSLRDGMLRTIAWHLDRDAPNGPSVETGDEFLKRNDLNTCAPDDLVCHKGRNYLPCSSECNIKDQCLPSIFDDVRELVQNSTEGCHLVLYTQSLGHNVEDMHLHSEYMDEDDLKEGDILICNLAFVPRESDLVTRVTEKVPFEQLNKFGVMAQPFDDKDTLHQRKLEGLNGRLLYRGWILIWVKDAMKPLSITDQSLMKLSPGKFFAPEVQNALFVEENFSVSPNIEDCLFLVEELKRTAAKERHLKRKFENDGVTKRVVYHLPSEPQRRAVILFAPLRYPNVDDPTVQKYRNGEKKLTIIDATKFMRYESGYDYVSKEPLSIRLQRQFYERVPGYVNREKELRSNFEPFYRYVMRHWVRTRWVVHDMKLEESRLLRCDWYREQAQWGTEIDQLSFAHVMALREVKRRIEHKEPDDHVKTFIEKNPDLRPYTDSYEWHAMETENNMLYREPIQWVAEIPAHIAALQEDHPAEDTEDENENDEDSVPLFIRIMSERTMAASRKRWIKKRKQMKKQRQLEDEQ